MMRLILLLMAPQILSPILFDKPSVSYYCRSITIDHTKVPSTQTNFPVLVSGTYSYLATVANGGRVQNANGYDIRFYPSSDCSGTKLNWETETWSATTGAVNYWMSVSSVSSVTDTVISVRYGETGINTDQSNATGVWDANYKLVSHLPNGTTLTANDSTSNGLNGTLSNTPTATTGKIDGAANFVSASSQSIGRTSGFPSSLADFTLSAWVRLSATSTINSLFQTAQNFSGIAFYLTNAGHPTISQVLVANNDFGTLSLSTSKTYYVVATRNSTTLKMYLYNFTDSTSGTQSMAQGGTESAGDGKYYIARSANGDYVDGWIDDVRWSAVDRGANWITTEYNNQSSPSTFYTIGAEVVH